MRFACKHCSTRYNIADDKVRAKVVKIRCRKCKAVMVVDGRRLEAPEPEPAETDEETTRMMPAPQLEKVLTRVRPPEEEAAKEDGDTTRMMSIADLERERRKSRDVGTGAGSAEVQTPRKEDAGPPAAAAGASPGPVDGWHAVIARTQHGPMSRSRLETEVAAGRITERTYVWHEDLDGWQPAADVPALASIFQAPVPAPSSPRAPADFLSEASAAPEPTTDDALFAKDELGGLFDDLGGEAPAPETPEAPAPQRPPTGETPLGGPAASPDPFADALGSPASSDPFAAALGDSADDPSDPDAPPRETTQMFIMASGVKKQKSPVRIAAFVLAFVGVFAGLGYLVSVAAGVDLSNIVPVGSDRREAQAWESSGGDEAFRDRMLGRDKAKAASEGEAQPRARRTAGGTAAPSGETEEERRVRERREAELEAVDRSQVDMLADLYGGDRGAVAVRARRTGGDRGSEGRSVDFDAENLQRRLAENQPAFESCVQQELRRNPRFRGGRVEMTLTVVPSGVVTGARIADPAIDRGEVGRCITRAARRMMLQSFPGEDPIEVVVPLVLSAAL